MDRRMAAIVSAGDGDWRSATACLSGPGSQARTLSESWEILAAAGEMGRGRVQRAREETMGLCVSGKDSSSSDGD